MSERQMQTSLATKAICALLVSLVGLMAFASAASASFSITDFSVSSTSPVAGAHPDLTTDLSFATVFKPPNFEVPDGNARDVIVELPPGLVANPEAVPRCEQLEFVGNACPPASQIGLGKVRLGLGEGFPSVFEAPIFNLKPRTEDETAEIGFSLFNLSSMRVTTFIRTDRDYGLNISSFGTSRIQKVLGLDLTIWGVPGDPIHDPERLYQDWSNAERPGPSSIARTPFLTNPTSCDGPLNFSAEVNSYQEPEVFDRKTAQLPQLTNCDSVPFAPEFTFTPVSGSAGASAGMPTGFESVLSLPQNDDPDGQATSSLRNAVVRLPEGIMVNPSSAVGLGGCADADLKLGSAAAATCPENAKIGTTKFDVPLFSHPIEGSIYLRQPGPGNLFRIALVFDEFGIHTKILGAVKPDPVTGRLTATFPDAPQLPLRALRLRFKGGDRALLMTPDMCGTYTTEAESTSWSGRTVKSGSKFTVTGNAGGRCAPGFEPKLAAGTKDPVAGAFSPFLLRLTREDGSQPITGLTAHLPKGLLGSLKGIPYCPEAALASISGDEGTGQAQIDNSTCPAPSQVGTVTVGAGGGANPFYTSAGRAYLAGPYKGARLSLAMVIPAVAGPFDLGSVVVRSALRIDPVTAEITTVSDPIPTILHGVPFDIRDIRVELSKPDFTVNPTSCEPMAVDATVSGSGGASAALSNRFQVGECASLGFKPKLALKLSGAPTRRGAHPALKAVLTMPKGGANIGSAQVTLPKTEFLENAHIRTLCTRVQYAANQCPKGSIYGYARAWSPLLDEPLQGPVYLRSSTHTLPDLVASLDGQIRVDLDGRISSANKRLRNTFDLVPDAPMSKFVLQMQGGQKGLIVNNEELCKAKGRAEADFTGQNGKHSLSRPLVKVAGCGGKKK